MDVPQPLGETVDVASVIVVGGAWLSPFACPPCAVCHHPPFWAVLLSTFERNSEGLGAKNSEESLE